MLRKLFAVCSLSIIALSSVAADLTGKVVKVADGDTITLLDANKVQHRIRFAQIDAPEKNQPWGAKSKDYLTRRIAGKTVTVKSETIDRYGRTVGTVLFDGVDICREQVAKGNAWVYTQYATDKNLPNVEKQARASKLGLWNLPAAERVAPWVWRKQVRNRK